MSNKHAAKPLDPVDKVITGIAKTYLSIETLETRGRDCLDFHDLSASQIRIALIKAFEAGQSAAKNHR